jgi:hypothetical protein
MVNQRGMGTEDCNVAEQKEGQLVACQRLWMDVHGREAHEKARRHGKLYKVEEYLLVSQLPAPIFMVTHGKVMYRNM